MYVMLNIVYCSLRDIFVTPNYTAKKGNTRKNYVTQKLTLSLPNLPFNAERLIKTSHSEPTNTQILQSVY
jgi:hypothetical protein